MNHLYCLGCGKDLGNHMAPAAYCGECWDTIQAWAKHGDVQNKELRKALGLPEFESSLEDILQTGDKKP